MKNQQIKSYKCYAEIFEYVSPASLQRDINENSVLEMREHIKEMYQLGLEPIFGVIDIVAFNNIYYVTDGQHRLKAIRDEWNENNIPISFYVIFYYVDTWEELEKIFIIRNKNVAIPSYILDRGDPKRNLLRSIENIINKGNFALIFNSKTIRPYINLTSFMNSLKDSNLIESINDANKFMETLNRENELVKNLSKNKDWVRVNKISDNMLNICRGTDIYLGLLKLQLWINNKYTEQTFLKRITSRFT